jgi:hypothetical protein
VRIIDFNGQLQSARASGRRVEMSYHSSARAIATLNVQPRSMELDGVRKEPSATQCDTGFVLMLPRGQHVVAIEE